MSMSIGDKYVLCSQYVVPWYQVGICQHKLMVGGMTYLGDGTKYHTVEFAPSSFAGTTFFL